MTKFKYNHIDFNGNFPKNKNANKALVDSGFFDQLYKRNISNEPNYAFCRNKVLTHAGKVVDSSLADQIISEISNLIWGKQRRCLGVQRVFLDSCKTQIIMLLLIQRAYIIGGQLYNMMKS